jgi:hemolysin activation/secretion protein
MPCVGGESAGSIRVLRSGGAGQWGENVTESGFRDGNLMKDAERRADSAWCSMGRCVVAAASVVLYSQGALAQAIPAAGTVGGAKVEIRDDALPSPVDAAAFPIPPGPERFLDPDDENRIFIQAFSVKGAVDRPKQGIDLKELLDLLEKQRIEKQGLANVGEDGFTADERTEVLGFFKRVMELREFDDYLFDDYSELVSQLREERQVRQSGLNLAQLQDVADSITKHYKDRGFILAQAFIPAQEVDDGKITIEVIEGRLGRVFAQNNVGYSEAVLAEPFEDLIDKPITNADVESAILTLRDYPGLVPTALFRPGAKVGTSDLVLAVQQEKQYEVSLTVDNDGSGATGERRVTLDAQYNNPTGVGDSIRGQLVQNWKPKNSLFFNATYERPIWPGTRAYAEFSRQDFAVRNDANLDLKGVLTQAALGVKHDVFRSRFSNIRTELTFRRTNSVLKTNKRISNKENLAFLEGRLTWDRIDTEFDGIDVATIGFAHGLNGQFGGDHESDVAGSPQPPSRRGNGGNISSNNFSLIRGQYNRLQAITEGVDVLMRVEGQASNSLLSSQNQYKLGGPNNVRAYPTSEFLRDTAVFGSMEWFFRAPGFADATAFSNLQWGDIVKVSFFADYAAGTVNQPQAGDRQNVDISGYGAALHMEIPGQFLARVQASHPLSGLPVSNDRATQWWFDINYRF